MSHWSQPLRVETPESVVLITIRTINSALWFVNNETLERHILAYLAKYVEKYGAILYAVCIQGSHIHLVIQFPNANRADFMRDLGARIAEGVRMYVPQFIGGPLLERRYTSQMLPQRNDVEYYFCYSALQAVADGLTQKISDYPGYNSLHDALSGITRTYKLVRWGDYHARKRYNDSVPIKDFTDEHQLSFARLPGYEDMPQKAYAKLLMEKVEAKRQEELKPWLEKKHRFMSKAQLQQVVPGTLPQKPKTGTMRPIVLCACQETRKKVLHWYFGVVRAYREASRRFRAGELDVKFPPMTYKPSPGLCLSP